MPCPCGQELLAFHLGELSEAEIAALGEHLASCPTCEQQARQLDGFNDTFLSALRRSSETDPTATRRCAYPDLDAPPGPPPEIPGYEMHGLVGRGGMGLVWKARHCRLDRLVALKALRGDCAANVERFQAEAQAVARLSHPNIVQIFEVAEYQGRPFLTLEYLDGGNLADHLNGKPQDPRASAAFVQKLARAVHYAHTQGIVHRDLKPANILLQLESSEPAAVGILQSAIPKISDFGIAKHLQDAGQTREGEILGTARYMAPEQANGKATDVGPASDIYSLGVILYEMLTGRVPLQGTTDLDTVLMVQKDEPVSPRQLQPGVPRDLETICLKCLRKEPGQRYASAEDLADDLGRLLAGEPIHARPTPHWERAWKWIRRRPTAAALVLVSTLFVGVGFPSVTYLWLQADHAHAQEVEHRKNAQAAAAAEREANQTAVEERAIAKAVNDFLLKDLLGQTDIAKQRNVLGRNKDITVRELLDRAAEKIAEKFRGQEKTEAAIRHTFGMTYRALGEYSAAQKHLERALALRKEKLGARHRDTLETMNNLAGTCWLDGKHDEAEALYQQVFDAYTATLGADHTDTLMVLGNLAMLDSEKARYAQAESRFKQVVDGFRELHGPDHEKTLHAMNNLAAFFSQRGRYDDAERLTEQVVAGYRRLFDADHPRTLQSMNNLATLYLQRRRFDKAEPLLNEVLASRRAKLGPEHADTLLTQHDLAVVYLEKNRANDAEPLLRQALTSSRVKPGPHHPLTHKIMDALARTCHMRGEFHEAEALFKEALESRRAKLPGGHPDTLVSLHNLGAHYRERGQYDKAEPLLLEAVEQARVKLTIKHPNTLRYMDSLALLYGKQGRPQLSEQLLRELAECMRHRFGLESAAYCYYVGQLCQNLLTQKKFDEVEPLLLADYRALKEREAEMLAQSKALRLRPALQRLVRLYEAWGKPDEAAKWHKELKALERE